MASIKSSAKDCQNRIAAMRARLSSYMEELVRAREELNSRALVRNLLALLNQCLDKARQLVEKYEDSGKPADDITDWHIFEIEVVKARSIAEEYLEKDSVTDNRRDTTPNRGAFYHVNLPKWELPKFDGDVLQFDTFWEQFEDQIHRQPEFKFTYLRSCLTGNALNAIDGLTVTAANYSAAIDILKSRFGRRDLIIQTHIRKLLDTTPCNDASLKTSRKFYDEIVLHIRALEALGKNPSCPELTASEVLLEIFKLKTHLSTRKRWETLILSEPSKAANLEDFLRFLQDGIRVQESVSMSDRKPSSDVTKRTTSPPREKLPSVAALHAEIRSSDSCVMCGEHHQVSQCPKFLAEKTQDRWRIVTSENLCFRCLRRGHTGNRCPEDKRCDYRSCGKTHHKLLHGDKRTRQSRAGETSSVKPTTEKDEGVSSSRTLLGRTASEKENLLQTARAILQSDDGNQFLVTCLLDSGCQRSLIRKDLAESLRLRGTTERLMLLRLGEMHSKYEKLRCVNFCLKSIYGGEDSYPIEALCVPRITTVDANPSAANWEHLHGLKLADIFPRERTEIDVLIGIDFYNRLLFKERIVGGDALPEAVNSPFGRILSGNIPADDGSGKCITLLVKTENEYSEDDLRRFWDLEIIGVADDKGKEDPSASRLMKTFEETLEYDNGRYTVKLPWKPGFPNVPNNYAHALQRLLKAEASLLKEPIKSEMYSKTLREYITDGIIERVENVHGDEGRTWYLPHHMVFKTDQTSTKGRIVFDASAHFGRTSLNRQLEAGPSLQSDLVRIPLRFRRHRIGLQADEPDDPSPPQTFRFRRICFGLTSSPFLALAVMQHHARLNKSKWLKAAEEVLKNVYVDDLLFSLDDRTETMECVRELKQLMETAGFHLTKWSSNEPSVLRSLPEEDVVSESKAKMALGIVWDSKEDIITFPGVSVERPDEQMTKRGMLSVIMKIFDSLGYLSPFLVKAKRMLQALWRKGIDWDTPLPQNILKDWRDWIAEIPSISEIRLPRCWLPAGTDCIKEVELHGYGDASEMAYGSAVYLKATTVSGETVVKLVMSKTRIAPVKRVTLPRLELMAALITARLISFVKTSLEIKFSKVVCWTDSQVALRWIQGDSYRWKPFVGNRVESILELTDAQWWRHCPTADNPADILTRGCRMKDLVSNNLWWHGPHWLTKCEDAWPMAKFESVIDRNPEFQAEVRKSARQLHTQTKVEPALDPQKYSSLTKLFNVTAYVFRFIRNCKVVPEKRKTTPLDVREIDQAEKFWLKAVQNEEFPEELESLKKEKKLPKSSRLWPLNPYVDDNGILRVGGRLRHSDLPFHTKYPVLLPNQHPLVKLLVRDQHIRQLHAGVDQTLSCLRQRYWIVNGRSAVKRVTKECVTCRRENAKPFSPKMSDLPRERVVEALPFENTGLDVAGPLYAREGNSVRKVYICLFTCMTTRAIHLELVSNLTAQRFLQALDRFFARRGQPRIIQSDNFTSFKEIGRNLNELVRETHRTLTSKRIEWKYITPRAPWCGGYWERLVRSVKTALRKVLGRTSLDEEELATVLCGIEAQVNARPLTFVGDDVSYLNALTPSHFLIGRASSDAPYGPNHHGQTTDTVGRLTKRWRYRKKLIAHFWKRWRS
ncbi:Transposon Tf2-6 polyprotein, partial [Trichinella nativa]